MGNDIGLEAELRSQDHGRYLLTLFAPSAVRPHLWSILSLDRELARLPQVVSQPMLGQMRIAWWRDAIDRALDRGDTGGNPILAGLVEAVGARKLNLLALSDLVDARERDLLRAPDASVAEFEADGAAAGIALGKLTLGILGLEEGNYLAATGRLGMARALTGILKAMPLAISKGQAVLPTGLDNAAGTLPNLTEGMESLARRIAGHLDEMAATKPPRRAFPALGEGVLLSRYLRRLASTRFDPRDSRLNAPDGLAPWALSLAWLQQRVR